MLAAALLCLTLPQQPGTGPGNELARVVDLPTVAERQRGADELAKKQGVSLRDWKTACASFRPLATPLATEPGPTRNTVELRVLDQVERTEVFVYVPKGYDFDGNKPAPLLLWCHGAGGSGAREHLLWQGVADKIGMLVLAATEFDQDPPGYRFTPRERAAQLAALRWARRHVNVDENAIFVGGWSRGGHLAWDLALRHPDQFAGVLPCVGGPRMEIGPANNLRYLENVAHLPICDLQGSEDDPLLLVNLRLAFARLAKLGAKEAKLVEFADRGHDADLGAVDWPAFFAHRRSPQPKRVVRLAADPAETRAAWLDIRGFERRVALEPQIPVDQGWDRLDDTKKRAFLLDKLADYTARLSVVDQGQGQFSAEGKNVTSFTLLLAEEQLGKAGAVSVRMPNRPTSKKQGIAESAVLLREFVERFDRTFLPIARVVVP